MLESRKANTKTYKPDKANVQSIMAMLNKIHTHEDDFTLNNAINSHQSIVLDMLKCRLSNTKNLNTVEKELDMMAWVLKHTFDEGGRNHKIYRA